MNKLEQIISKYHNVDLTVLFVRIALALVFIAHGWVSLQSGQAVLGGAIQFVGGLCVLLGVFTRYAALVLSFTMAITIYVVKFHQPFLGGIEYEVTLLLASLALIFSDAGAYSIRRFLSR